jgi:hypothetical protein
LALNASCPVRLPLELFIRALTTVLAMNVETFDFVKSCILSRFPASSVDFTPSSIAALSLSRLSMSLWSLSLPNESEPVNLDAWRSSVELSLLLLEQLGRMLSHPEDYFDSEPGRKGGQKQKKKQKHLSASRSAIDKKPFVALDVPLPTTEAQALKLERVVVVDQKGILEVRAYVDYSALCR